MYNIYHINFTILFAIHLADADGGIKRFHDMKTEWGFTKFLTLDCFCLPCSGYLVNDCCVFGVEVFVHECKGKREILSMIKEPANRFMIWKIDKFSTLNKVAYNSQMFTVEDLKWYFYF